MNKLEAYSTLEMEKFLNFLKNRLNLDDDTSFPGKRDTIDFVARLQEELPSHTNTFTKGSKRIMIQDRRMFEIYLVKTNDDPFLSLPGRNERTGDLVAEAYFEKGKDAEGRFKGDPYADDEYDYEYMKLTILDDIDLQSGRKIPECTIKIQTVSRCPPNIGLRRRDHEKTFFCWHRTNLEKVLPHSLFLKNPELKYYPVADI